MFTTTSYKRFACCYRRPFSRFTNTPFSTLVLQLPELLPESKRLYLVRHGETDWNKLGKMQGGGFDIPLNENGIQQAKALAHELRDMPLQVIASSHLARASQTADAVHQLHPHADRIIRPEFGEFRFGKFEGLALHGKHKDQDMKKEFDEMNEGIYADVKCAWPDGGESTGDVDKRMRLALDDLLLENHAHMCIVGHGRSNRVLLASLLYGDPLQHRDIEQGNTCISVLDVNRDGKWMLHLMNHVEHTKK